jgi:hypothetical protein
MKNNVVYNNARTSASLDNGSTTGMAKSSSCWSPPAAANTGNGDDAPTMAVAILPMKAASRKDLLLPFDEAAASSSAVVVLVVRVAVDAVIATMEKDVTAALFHSQQVLIIHIHSTLTIVVVCCSVEACCPLCTFTRSTDKGEGCQQGIEGESERESGFFGFCMDLPPFYYVLLVVTYLYVRTQ